MDPVYVVEIVILITGATAGLAGVYAAVWAVGKVRGVEATIELLKSANDALREANSDLRLQLASSERECGERIARLEGQNQALLDGVGDKVANAIAHQVEAALFSVASRVVDEIARRSTDREHRVHAENGDHG